MYKERLIRNSKISCERFNIVRDYQMCNTCVMDTSVHNIKFNSEGRCNYCKLYENLEEKYPDGRKGFEIARNLAKKIKKTKSSSEYDCVVGISGGCDSSFLLYLAVLFGLKPLAVYFDSGWGNEISVQNIFNVTKKLDVDLYTHVADWEEFKGLQRSFIKASVSDADIPTDYAVFSVLYSVANKFNIKYILSGHSFRTELSTPLSWTYMDGRYVDRVHKLFNPNQSINSFPIMQVEHLLYYTVFKGIKFVDFLETVPFDKKNIMSLLEKKLDWKYYGGHHHDNNYTVFFQSEYLPKKFGIDKRLRELSALVLSKQINRKEAIKILEDEYPINEDLNTFVLNKLDFSKEEFDLHIEKPNKTFLEYETYLDVIKTFKPFIKFFCDRRILPKTFYEKYFGS